MILLPGRGGNEQKFLGDGQTFKGKLIGVLEVREARGDRMCQDALQELKMAIKASGEHKQKVNIQIAVDGLKIRDEKSGVSLESTNIDPLVLSNYLIVFHLKYPFHK